MVYGAENDVDDGDNNDGDDDDDKDDNDTAEQCFYMKGHWIHSFEQLLHHWWKLSVYLLTTANIDTCASPSTCLYDSSSCSIGNCTLSAC